MSDPLFMDEKTGILDIAKLTIMIDWLIGV
jgi:hypothetical protein